MMHLRSLFLLLAMFAVSGCGIQKASLQPTAAKQQTGSSPTDSSQKDSNQTGAQQAKPIAKQQLSTAGMSPSFLYLASQKALKDGKHALAIELLRALVKKDPDAIDPHLQLTTLLLASGQADKASAHLDSLLASKKLSPGQQEQLQLARIRLFLEQGRTELALQGINDFLKTRPTHITGRDIQVRILSSLKRYDEALAAIAEAIRVKELPEFRLLQAQLMIKNGDFMAAKISLIRMQKLAPNLETPVLMLGVLAVKDKHVDEAEKLLRDFIASHPDSLRVNLALGKLLIQQKRVFDAIMTYRDIAIRTGNNPDILRQLGMLYFQHKDYAEAEATFRNLVEVRPDDMSRFYLAASMEAQGKVAEASALYAKIDTGSVLATEAQVRLAAIDVSHDKFEQASQRLQKILKAKPDHLDAHLMLSAIRLTQKKFRKLIDETDPLMDKKKLPSQLLFNRAVAFDHFKQYEQAEVMLNRIIDRHPDYAEALNFLGYSYAVQGIKLDKAKMLIQRALRKKPNDGYYLDSLAWAYYKNGEYAKAAGTQAKALKQVSDDSVMHEHYGDIMWKKGKQAAARKAWKKAIELKSDHAQQLQQKIKFGINAAK